MSVVLQVPRGWLALIMVAACASTLNIERIAGGGFQIGFHVTTITAILIGLIWLPALLRVIAIAGGGLKTPAGEASTPGLMDFLKLLDPQAQRETLPTLIAAADVTETSPANAQSAQRWRQEFEDRLATLLATQPSAHELLEDIARTYERIRNEQRAGPDRTFRMTELVAQARALRESVTSSDVVDLFNRGSEGLRIVALGLVQAEPTGEFFELVRDGIASSRSAFEQYQSLRAATDMLPTLSRQQRESLAEALEGERADVRGTEPQADSSRWQLMSELYRRLVPPPSMARSEALRFDQRVREVLESSPEVLEIAQPTGGDVGIDYVIRVGDRRVVVEVKNASGPNQTRRIREAMNQVERALDRLSADAALVVVPQLAGTGQELPDPRIRITTPEDLPAILASLR
jgi:hypothetical protein